MSGDDLGEFEDEVPATDAPRDADGGLLGSLSEDPREVFAAAKLAAMTPKPKIEEMIREIGIAAADIEGVQERLLLTGAGARPYEPYMRRAAVLTSAMLFLELVKSKQEPIKRILREGR